MGHNYNWTLVSLRKDDDDDCHGCPAGSHQGGSRVTGNDLNCVRKIKGNTKPAPRPLYSG